MNKDKLKEIAAEIVAAKKAEKKAPAKPAKPEAPAKGKPEAPKTEPATAKAPKPAADKPAAAPAKTEAKPAPAKPAKADKGAPAKPVEAPKAAKPAAPAETWPQMLARHARDMAAIGVQVTRPKSGKYHQLPAGVFVPGAKMSEYAALFARHINERRALRDTPATASACFRWALAEWEGDEIAALNSLGMAHNLGGDGRITCPALRNRAPAEAWAAALAEAKPCAASRVVSVAAICGKAKPAAKPEAKPAATAKPNKGDKGGKPKTTASKGGIVNLAP